MHKEVACNESTAARTITDRLAHPCAGGGHGTLVGDSARPWCPRSDSPRKKSAFARFLLQFHNVLIVSGAVTVLLGHWVGSGVILGVVVSNAIIGFIQEGKAKRALPGTGTRRGKANHLDVYSKNTAKHY